jgi:hypothetical protein
MKIARPHSVKLALGCLAISISLSLISTLVTVGFTSSRFAYQIFGLGLVLLLAVMIYRCKNWARWIFAGCAVAWLVALLTHVRALMGMSILSGLVLAVQLMLWAAMVVLLFSPAANEWFRTQKQSA